MMNNIWPSIGWCAIQVSLVAFAGIVVSMLVSKRNSLIACAIVCQAALMCMLLTMLAFVPAHRLFVLESRPKLTHLTPTTKHEPVRHHAVMPEESPVDDMATLPTIDLTQLAFIARLLTANLDPFEKRGGNTIGILCWTVFALGLIGILRLAVGIGFIVRLRHNGIPVDDPVLLDLVDQLAARLECRSVPRVCESSLVTDAAVAGWIRPTLVLPCDWRQWSTDERRSVIAHELVHIHQLDSLWRTAASLVMAIHFYNPVVHWMLRRIVLCQELSADAIAANVVGRTLYLKSLSSLAIRRDDRLMKRGITGLLPVFSGFLIRRIKMLHSTEGKIDMQTKRKRKLTSRVISAAFLVTGLVAIVARGIAQPPNEDAHQTAKAPHPGPLVTASKPAVNERAEQRDTSKTGGLVLNADKGNEISFVGLKTDRNAGPEPSPEMFHRQPLDSALLGSSNQIGMAVLRVAELLNQPELKSYVPILNAYFSSSLWAELKWKNAPEINLECIEWIAVRPVVSFTAETKEKKSQFVVGAGGLSIKLTHPIDLKQWFQQFGPDLKRQIIEGKDVYQLNAAFIGPDPFFVWSADEMTIRISGHQPQTITAETKLADFDTNPVFGDPLTYVKAESQSVDQGVSPKWNPTWNRIEGGLLSILVAKADLSGLIRDLDDRPDFKGELATKAGQLVRAMQSRCTAAAFGFDIGSGNSLVGIRCRFAHASLESAQQSADEIRELLTVANSELAKVLEATKQSRTKDAHELDVICTCIEALSTLTAVDVDDYEDGTAATVITGALPFRTFFALAVMASKDDSAEDSK